MNTEFTSLLMLKLCQVLSPFAFIDNLKQLQEERQPKCDGAVEDPKVCVFHATRSLQRSET